MGRQPLGLATVSWLHYAHDVIAFFDRLVGLIYNSPIRLAVRHAADNCERNPRLQRDVEGLPLMSAWSVMVTLPMLMKPSHVGLGKGVSSPTIRRLIVVDESPELTVALSVITSLLSDMCHGRMNHPTTLLTAMGQWRSKLTAYYKEYTDTESLDQVSRSSQFYAIVD